MLGTYYTPLWYARKSFVVNTIWTFATVQFVEVNIASEREWKAVRDSLKEHDVAVDDCEGKDHDEATGQLEATHAGW